MLFLLWKRDVMLAFRRRGAAGAALAFCLAVFATFAFSLGPEALQANAGRVLAVSVLLSCLLSLPNLFERDVEDGTLEQYLLQPVALEWLVLAKLAAFWVATALPLVALAPLFALMGGLDMAEALRLQGSLLLATPSLCAIGALGAALTLSLRQGGLTQALIVLPLYVPPLIFLAAGANTFLAGMALAAVPVACLACAGLLRMAYE